MDERIEKWLYDIHFSIEEIESYFPSEEKNFFDYKKNSMRKRAVERHLEIIGEALNRILKSDSSYEDKIKNARSIVGLRNQVIHAYDNISDENIWSILVNHLPKLKLDVNKFLNI